MVVCGQFVSVFLVFYFWVVSLEEVPHLIEFVWEHLVHQFVLSWKNGDNVISRFIFLVASYFLPFPHIQISCDLGKENSESENDDTPWSIDHVPNGGCDSLNHDHFLKKFDGGALVLRLNGVMESVDCPEVLLGARRLFWVPLYSYLTVNHEKSRWIPLIADSFDHRHHCVIDVDVLS